MGGRSIDIDPGASRDGARVVDDGEVVFFRYVDKSGREIVTNELASVPKDALASLELIDPSPKLAELPAPSLVDDLGRFHLPSFAFGACSMLLVVMVGVLFRRAKILIRVVAFVVVLALVAGAYFAWAMQSAGLGSGRPFENPARAVDEAKAAKAKAEERGRAQEALFKALEEP